MSHSTDNEARSLVIDGIPKNARSLTQAGS